MIIIIIAVKYDKSTIIMPTSTYSIALLAHIASQHRRRSVSRHVKKERFGNMYRVLVHACKIRGGSGMVPSVPRFVPVHADYIARAYKRPSGYKLNCLPWLLNKLLEREL